ncbi:MAG: sulfatase, partial [Candidatus Hydrogenedentota bacterium]
MDPLNECQHLVTRRQFFGLASAGIGTAALSGIMGGGGEVQASIDPVLKQLHHAPKAKRVIYLFQSGGPSQMDLFDYKPEMKTQHGEELPGSIRMGQRITGMTSGQSSFPVASSMFDFKQHGESGAWVSELLPHTAKIADDLCFIKTVNTEAINHDPGITY